VGDRSIQDARVSGTFDGTSGRPRIIWETEALGNSENEWWVGWASLRISLD
jgi:hypothetical protein